ITKMRRLVRKANMQVRMVTLSAEWYKSDMGIVLGYYRDAKAGDEDEHEFVALLPEDGHYVLVSPSHPFGLEIDHGVAARIQENAFLCYPCLPAQKLGVKELLRFMVRHIPSVDIHVIWAISLISGILALVMPLITENIFSDIIPINDRQALGTVTQVMLVSGLTTAILGVVRSIACLRIKVRIGMFVESAMWARLLSLPLRFFRQYQAGDIINRMQGVREITTLLEDHMLTVIFNTLFSFISIGLMLHYSVKLTAVAFGVWIVYALMILPLYRRLGLLQQKKVQADNERSARTLQILNGLTKFKLQGGEETAFRLWTQTFGNSWNWNLKMRWATNYSEVINVIQPVILTMAVFYITSKTAVGQESQQLLGVAAFMGFQAAFSTFNATFVSFMSLLPSLYNIVPHVKNIMPILETEPEVTEDKLDAGVLSGEIDVRDLHFSYVPDAPMILKGLTFRIEAGESVAFVGPSGCGKSTLLRILLGMEQPTQGAVFYDGQDFSKLDVASVRSQMGVVLQNGQLMGGEIYTNIIGALPLTIDDAWEAAGLVGLDRDIKEMPMGMHTYISEGASNISGGQRQRILLARSLVNKPKIVVLDEATSALDNRTQAIVTESINKLGSTRIIVAHRLSTIRDVDRIFVLHDGQIAEEGNFEQLMEKNGLFAQLAQRQME
ncbi:MAG: NHLP bacteriocin export ABC transporter permease/ATPase subunit, partial [Azoarcus sp.]|nr:NHLP bacteriocin export ABC transporter permease/ATPase subunit [Azoarcus sp.]